jgi:hypothetical protein
MKNEGAEYADMDQGAAVGSGGFLLSKESGFEFQVFGSRASLLVGTHVIDPSDPVRVTIPALENRAAQLRYFQ